MKPKTELSAAIVLLGVFIALAAAVFVTADKNLAFSAYLGPLNFWLNFPWLYVMLGFAGLSVFLLLGKIEHRRSLFFISFLIALGTYIVKILLPYYLFDFVHYDIFTHYMNVEMINSNGITFPGYASYQCWPNTFLLTDIFEKITGTAIPLSVNLLALISEIILVISLFAFVKKLFGSREAILSILALTIVGPVSIHYSPFTITLTLIFLAFVLFFYGVFDKKPRLKLLSVLIAMSTVLYHAYLPITLGVMILVGIICLSFLSRFYPQKALNKEVASFLVFPLALIIGTLTWWFAVSVFVFHQLITTITGIFTESASPLILSLSPSAQITGQLTIMAELGAFTRFILPAIVIIPVLLVGIRLLYRKKFSDIYVKIFTITSIALAIALVWLGLIFAGVGFGERFLYITLILVSILTAISILKIETSNRLKKLIYGVLFALFLGCIIITPITNATDYSVMYYTGITSADLAVGHFTAGHFIEGLLLTGDLRFQGMIAAYSWPNTLSFSTQYEFTDKINDESYVYNSLGIIVNPGTANFVSGRSNITQAVLYISQMPNHFNIIYDNNYDLMYSPIIN